MAIRLLDSGEAEKLRALFAQDGELKQVSRDMTLNLCIEIGGDKRLIKVRDGEFKSIGRFVPMTESIDVSVKAAPDFWQKVLSPIPPPNFQNLYAGVRFKTCEVSGSSELYFAYFAAITRMVEIMRDHQNS